MTLDEICAIFERVTYKPDGCIAFFPASREVRVSFFVDDTTAKPKKKIHISLSKILPPDAYFHDEKVLMLYILNCVDDAERHETREWLKLDGVAIFDPHKEGT